MDVMVDVTMDVRMDGRAVDQKKNFARNTREKKVSDSSPVSKICV